jgi:tetratricopeptide (TPR) repeat protein
MKLKFILAILLLCFLNRSFGQKIYDVEPEVRDKSVFVNNTALEMIDKGDYELAAKILERVVETDPSFHPAYLNFYRSGGQLPQWQAKVEKVLRLGLAVFEEDDEMAYYLGNLLQRQQKYDKAIEAYSDAIRYSKVNGEDFPLVWAYYFNRGNCFLKTNKHKEAIPDYNNALRLSPENADVLTNRGFCLYKTGKTPEACKDWQRALKLGNKVTEKYLQQYCK